MSWFNKVFGAQSPASTESSHPTMRDYLSTNTPDINRPIRDTLFLVADLEMSGLNPAQDEIVSIGWVSIENLQITHTNSRHFYINNTEVNLDQSAPIHKISHSQLSQGVSQEVATNEFLSALKGKVLVLHHAPIDMGFLNKICETLYGASLNAPIVDTMAIEHRRLSRKGKLEGASLRLNDCRTRYSLPQYQAHNAAVDALATAELLLAQIAHEGANGKTKLKNYLS